MSSDLPFRAEYAKSGRASCKQCKSNIMKDELRLAKMVQSPHFDGKVPNWFHFRCFFGRFKVPSEGDIEHFESLRWDDQTKIKEKLVGGAAVGTSNGEGSSAKKGEKGKKRKGVKADSASKNQDFETEYSKSSRSSCKYCEMKIEKGVVRISKKDYESEKAIRFGPLPMWYHVDCFVKAREELEFFDSGDSLPGFGTLGIEDQKSLKAKLKKIANKVAAGSDVVDGAPDIKKVKVEVDNEEKKLLKAQNDLLFGYHDKLKNALTKKELVELLEFNEQGVPSGESRVLDRLADIMAFGALEPCPECQGQLAFSNTAYFCTGNITEWTKCQHSTKSPKRRAFVVPDEFKENFSFLKSYKYKKKERVFPSVQAAPSVPKTLPTAAASKACLPLENAKIAILGKPPMGKDQIKKKVEELGGKIISSIDAKTACIISTPEEVKKGSKKMKQAEQMGIHVVSEEFLKSVEKGGAALMIIQHSIATWGNKPEDRLEIASLEKKSKSEVQFGGKSSTMKMKIKGASVVEHESGLADIAHVLEHKGVPMTAVLGMVDITRGTNSYYKLQILEADKGNGYWVFRSWGRVGTTIGGNKVDNEDSRMSAISEFKRLYEEKTGNSWENRDNFEKQAGRFYPLEIDYGQNEETSAKLVPGAKSALAKSVQELICLIFDVESMKKAMVEFEIDLKKMPLGKLSKRQMEKAYSVLTEIQELITSGGSDTKFLDASNRFYTLIPHDFGMKAPPLLKTEDVIKSKIQMLDSLMEIEIAYNLLKSAEESGAEVDPVDAHYKKLKTEIEELEKSSEEFALLQKYLKNTHASTHSSYALNIQNIFKIKREGEAKKYKPFQKLHNRQLLWHGSRVTNFAGILSQGLRIAPPEAPVTGYMFGKGVYFADMVSKSANYCCSNVSNNVGLLLLCEVALGNMYERTNAEMITKLPPNMHCTKGLGSTHPDPKEVFVTPEGVTIPFGKPTSSNVSRSSLLYNEYIVYDTAQVNIKYLLKVNFKYNYGR